MTKDEPKLEEIDAEGFRQRMLFIATELLKKPRDRELTADEGLLFVKGAMALAEMFVGMDEKLCQGFVPPRSWTREVPEPGKLPTSDLHQTLKMQSEVIVQKMLERIEKRIGTKDPVCAKALMESLGKLLATLALFTSESVRLACLNNIKPVEAGEGKPRLALVKDGEIKADN